MERQEKQVTRDSKERYVRIAMFRHGGMALRIGWQLLKIFDRVADGEHWIGQTLVPCHVSIGTLLLLLIALRTVWAVRQKGSRPEQDPATAFLEIGRASCRERVCQSA